MSIAPLHYTENNISEMNVPSDVFEKITEDFLSAITDSGKNLLCCALMVKNEEERAIRTIRSVAPYIDYMVVLDTGSTDNTIEMIRDVCTELNLPLKLEELLFEDFSTNRNHLFKLCRGLSEYILVMDANSVVQNAECVRPFLESVLDEPKHVCFGCRMRVDNDNQVKGRSSKFMRINIVRNNNDDVKYECPVHEYITVSKHYHYMCNNYLQELTDFCIYQDRMTDKPSLERIRLFDIPKLREYIAEKPIDFRAKRYLCQSYYNIKDMAMTYKLTSKLVESMLPYCKDKFDQNYLTILLLYARSSFFLKKDIDVVIQRYNRAYKYEKELYINNYEIPYELALKLCMYNDYDRAYFYAKIACNIPELPEYLQDIQIDELIKKNRWRILYELALMKNSTEDIDLAMKKMGKSITNTNTRIDFTKDPEDTSDINDAISKEVREKIIYIRKLVKEGTKFTFRPKNGINPFERNTDGDGDGDGGTILPINRINLEDVDIVVPNFS